MIPKKAASAPSNPPTRYRIVEWLWASLLQSHSAFFHSVAVTTSGFIVEFQRHGAVRCSTSSPQGRGNQ